MKEYPLSISSPDGDLYKGDVAQLNIRAAEGDMAVMAGHVPFVTNVQAGKCSLILPDGSRKEGTIGMSKAEVPIIMIICTIKHIQLISTVFW